MLSTDQEEQLREMMIRKQAEKLRLQAVHLAAEYRKLCRRHDLSPGIVEDDSKAVIAAWARLP